LCPLTEPHNVAGDVFPTQNALFLLGEMQNAIQDQREFEGWRYES
jgi:hypothetical protein